MTPVPPLVLNTVARHFGLEPDQLLAEDRPTILATIDARYVAGRILVQWYGWGDSSVYQSLHVDRHKTPNLARREEELEPIVHAVEAKVVRARREWLAAYPLHA